MIYMPDKDEDEDADNLTTRILELNARLKEEDEIVTVVLKAHLQVEQFVNQVLEELAVNPEPLSLYSGSSRFAQNWNGFKPLLRVRSIGRDRRKHFGACLGL